MRTIFMLASILLFFYLVAATPTAARVWYVPSEAPTIQAGIDSAAAGDTVKVACGTYYEHDVALKSGIELMSDNGSPDCVIVDAQAQGRVLFSDQVENTTIHGLTLSGGVGGGVYCEQSAFTLTNCHVVGNSGNLGGGVACGSFCYMQFDNCTFEDNYADNLGGAVYFGMAAMHIPTVFNSCSFLNNATGGGGGAFCCRSTWHIFNSCDFQGNTAGMSGGAISQDASADLDLHSCRITDNSALDRGGGIYVTTGAIGSSSFFAERTEILDNSAPIGPDGSLGVYCYVSLVCCDVNADRWDNWGGLLLINNENCDPEPTIHSTWGSVKAMYRRASR